MIKEFTVFEYVKGSLHTSLPVVLWLTHSVAGGSHPTKQRKQSVSLNKRQSLTELTAICLTAGEEGKPTRQLRGFMPLVETGHERSKSQTSRFTNIHTLLQCMLSWTGTQSSSTLRLGAHWQLKSCGDKKVTVTCAHWQLKGCLYGQLFSFSTECTSQRQHVYVLFFLA